MIKHLIDLLNQKDYYGVSKDIDIAKGLYEIPKTYKGSLKQIKRIYHGR